MYPFILVGEPTYVMKDGFTINLDTFFTTQITS